MAMNRNTGIGIAVAVIVVVLVGFGGWYLAGSEKNTAMPVTVGLAPVDNSALFYIAEDQHFFRDNGLAVTLRDYNPPAAGVTGMLDGEVDMASSTEYPVVLNAFRSRNFSVITRYNEVEIVYLIGLKDHGIVNISDLMGKKVGVTRGTIGEYDLGMFLTLHGMNISDVTLVDVQPGQFDTALASGGIDALVCWQPYSGEIAGHMGERVVAWPAQSDQPLYAVLVARNDWIARNPGLAEKFLKSLDMAAGYAAVHPAEAQAIVEKHLDLSDSYMASAWPGNHFSLSLDQSLVLAMEDEARWMIANNLTNATAVPDFGKYIYPDALNAVKPGSVNLF